jgi:hypothetical protein
VQKGPQVKSMAVQHHQQQVKRKQQQQLWRVVVVLAVLWQWVLLWVL